MRVEMKRKAEEASTSSEAVGTMVKAEGESSAAVDSGASRAPAVEGKRARKQRIMRENGQRFVTFYISTELWKRFIKLYCPRGTAPNVVFCRMIRQAVEARSENGADGRSSPEDGEGEKPA